MGTGGFGAEDVLAEALSTQRTQGKMANKTADSVRAGSWMFVVKFFVYFHFFS